MMQSRIPGYTFLALLMIATPAFARVVISEVMWMGSDLSTADEWVELTGVDDGAASFPLSLSGWTLRVQSGTGENVLARFGGDVGIQSGQYLLVSNYPAAASRLVVDPALSTTAMMLPNTKLLLRLYDGHGTLVDEVDDGVGVPFAGANPSGGGPQASMERISLLGAGNAKENWQTALRTLGFDPGAPIFGTPGFPRLVETPSPSSSFFSFSSLGSSLSSISSQSSSASAASRTELSSSAGVSPAPRSSSQASEVGSCAPDVSNIHIAIQSGEPRSEGKVTVNLQLLWQGKGTLRCIWDYRDGFTSTSCNPPSHTFTVPGTYDVRVDTEDVCGGKNTQTFPIEVLAGGEASGSGGGAVWRASSASSQKSCTTPQTFAGIEITRFLPNPHGEDSIGEWVELKNVSDRRALLCGWTLDDAEGGSTPFSLDAVTLASQEIRRFPASLTGLGLNNDQDHVRLVAPENGGGSLLVQDVSYRNAREGVVMNALFSIQETQGRVVRIIDGDTVVLEIEGREVTVRFLGIDTPEPGGKNEEDRWGKEATEFLRGLLDGVHVELNFDEERQDVYGRILAYISIGGHDVQAELLQRGLAMVYQRCTCTRKEKYRRLEEEARRKNVGMWGGWEGTPALEPSLPAGKAGPVRGAVKDKELEDKGKRVEVFLSEVYPVPLPAEGEWVELWNSGEEPLNLSGWKLDDVEDGGSVAWEFPVGFVIQPGAFIVLRSHQTHLAFNNEGDSVLLIAPDGTIIDHMMYGKLRRGRAFARIIQRIGSTGKFRTTDRLCVTDHPTPFERNICGEALVEDGPQRRACPPECGAGLVSDRQAPARRGVVRLARRIQYRNVLPPDVSSGSVATPDPILAALLEHIERSQSGGQVVWRREESQGKEKNAEWEAILLPFFLVAGAHSLLIGIRGMRRSL